MDSILHEIVFTFHLHMYVFKNYVFYDVLVNYMPDFNEFVLDHERYPKSLIINKNFKSLIVPLELRLLKDLKLKLFCWLTRLFRAVYDEIMRQTELVTPTMIS